VTLLALTSETTAGRETLGGKAWSITEMLRHGIPVPPAFALTTDECHRYYDAGRTIPGDVLLPARHSAPGHGHCWYRSAQAPRPACRG